MGCDAWLPSESSAPGLEDDGAFLFSEGFDAHDETSTYVLSLVYFGQLAIYEAGKLTPRALLRKKFDQDVSRSSLDLALERTLRGQARQLEMQAAKCRSCVSSEFGKQSRSPFHNHHHAHHAQQQAAYCQSPFVTITTCS